MSEIDWPGWSICFSSAVVNGELRPVPSAATESGSVAKAMKVPEPVCTRPSPLAIDDAERFSDAASCFSNGLSRQASRKMMLVLEPRSSCCMTPDSDTSEMSISAWYSTCASMGTR